MFERVCAPEWPFTHLNNEVDNMKFIDQKKFIMKYVSTTKRKRTVATDEGRQLAAAGWDVLVGQEYEYESAMKEKNRLFVYLFILKIHISFSETQYETSAQSNLYLEFNGPIYLTWTDEF